MRTARISKARWRSAIIDLSPRSNQPMGNATTGLALVFNGTIYNYPHLRSELIALDTCFLAVSALRRCQLHMHAPANGSGDIHQGIERKARYPSA